MTPSYAGIGARRTPVAVCAAMRALAGRLAGAGWWLRSGGAHGADEAFAAGAGERQTGYLPWRGFNGRTPASTPGELVVPGDMVRLEEEAARHHPAWARCTAGVRRMHARNVAILVGEALDDPVAAVVCWTPRGETVGGTGMGLRIARAHGIPAFNLAVHGAGEVEQALARLSRGPQAAAGEGACVTQPSPT